MTEPCVDWTAVVVTCQTTDSALAIQHELLQRQRLGIISDSAIVLAVEDPQDRVGSGGATLNALLVVAEHISAKHKFNVVNPDVFHESKILILHLGRQYNYEMCGRAFLPLPFTLPKAADCATVTCNLDILYYLMTYKIAKGTCSGVWICSTDMLLSVPENLDAFNYNSVDVCAISVPGSVQYATQHGVYRLANEQNVCDILYQGANEEVEKFVSFGTNTVPLVSGVVYLSSNVAETMLSFHTSPPLDACTYMGIDSGAEPIQLSLFFDLLLAMCPDVSEEDFVSGSRSGSYGKKGIREEASMRLARQQIWELLRPYRIHLRYIPEGQHLYLNQSHSPVLDTLREYTSVLTLSTDHRMHTFIEPNAHIAENVSVQNSYIEDECIIGRGCVITNCCLTSAVTVGDNCMVKGIQTKDNSISSLNIRNNTILIGVHITSSGSKETGFVYITWGIRDDLMKVIQPGSSDSQTFCNVTLETFFEETGISWHDLWDDSVSPDNHNLYNAKLYPVFRTQDAAATADMSWIQSSVGSADQLMLSRWKNSKRVSLCEVLESVDFGSEFHARRCLFHTIGLQMVEDTLIHCRDRGLSSLHKTAVMDGVASQYLDKLDQIAGSCRSASIAARTLANIANLLGTMSHGNGGLRSGPASNKQWASAFDLLEKGDIERGVVALSAEREHWLSRPELLIRAARHYEGAAQILIRQAVMSAKQFIQTSSCDRPAVGQWITASCPARIDIAGGWSDTPPITYEHGGAVINAAVAIDGERPIGARVRRIKELHILLSIVNCGQTVWSTVISDINQLADSTNPHAPGALLKAAIVCADVVKYPSEESLEDQLAQRYGAGFELQSSSNLKHGSGLGTSSILAGVMIAVLWRASGRSYDTSSLNHAVSYLEQVLTTGGGWQDTVGGLTGGIKVGHSEAELPMKIETTYPAIPNDVVEAFSKRLLLVYTGKTRLARNLLQNVLRNWYARDPDIVHVIDELVDVAWRCARCFEQGDLAAVGSCMNDYWELKKQIATGSEPLAVTHMMNVLRPHAYGLCLAGAGGGGYMYVLMKEPQAIEKVRDILSTIQDIPNVTVHNCTIDMLGLEVKVEGES